MAILLECLISSAFFIPINLTSICGWPKYPSPQASEETTDIKATLFPSDAVKAFNNSGFTELIFAIVALRPPILSTAATGTITIAININIPWTKSVQHTAKNPPAKV